MKFTVLGGNGFIGSHLVAALGAAGIDCFAPARGELAGLGNRPLGHVVYAIGLTADFRHRPLDTVEAHVALLADVLRQAEYDSFVYLSSARVYGNAEEAVEEARFTVDPRSPSDLYDLSKLLGESACLAAAGPKARIVRLSNVYGPDWESENFLMTLIRDAVERGAVEIGTAPESAKDYIAVEDVVALLIDIARRGSRPIYNVASGNAVRNAEIARALSDAAGCRVSFARDAPFRTFPPIDVTRIRDEFAFRPRSLIEDIPRLVAAYRRAARP